MGVFCGLCHSLVPFPEFDLLKTTSKSNNPLIKVLVESGFQQETFVNHSICKCCCLLLDELDTVKQRAKAIENELKNYILKPKTVDNHDLPAKKTEEMRQEESLFDCTICGKKWQTLTKLKTHFMTHSNEKPYICEICGQSYKKQKALTVHVGMHKGINPFTCQHCKKSFTQKGALVRHVKIHTGEFPFQCDLCGKRFVHHTSFNIHKLSHEGKKSYKCETCGLLLISTSHLKRHMRVHTGEKKYTCGTCGKKCAERYNLAVHERLHFGDPARKKYKCRLCEEFFAGPVKLEEHLMLVHQKI